MFTKAYAQDTQPAGGGSALAQFLPIILIFVVFYFLLIRPQQKQQKRIKQMIADAKRGDEVVLTSGLYGTIAEIQDGTILVQASNNVKLKFDKSAIQKVLGYGEKK